MYVATVIWQQAQSPPSAETDGQMEHCRIEASVAAVGLPGQHQPMNDPDAA